MKKVFVVTYSNDEPPAVQVADDAAEALAEILSAAKELEIPVADQADVGLDGEYPDFDDFTERYTARKSSSDKAQIDTESVSGFYLERVWIKFVLFCFTVSSSRSACLCSAQSSASGLCPGLRFRTPRIRRMVAVVTGFNRIPSDVASTKARVPSSMWNSFRSRTGMTTRPFFVNRTVSALGVVLMAKSCQNLTGRHGILVGIYKKDGFYALIRIGPIPFFRNPS